MYHVYNGGTYATRTCVDVIHEIPAPLTVFNVKFNFDYPILYFATKLTMFRFAMWTIGSVNSIEHIPSSATTVAVAAVVLTAVVAITTTSDSGSGGGNNMGRNSRGDDGGSGG